MNVLLTNDDGIHAAGLQALRRALIDADHLSVAVVAPETNRSAVARSISLHQPMWVEQVEFDDGTTGFATDGTPVDCVRLTAHGLIDGFEPSLIVSGINHGSNLGDDITYSGTVAAALEGLMLGVPAVAFSHDVGVDGRISAAAFERAASFAARLVDRVSEWSLPPDILLNVNFPFEPALGVEVTTLGKRIYGDELELIEEALPRRRFRLYGTPTGHEDVEGSDLNAVAERRIAVTPLHFDLTSVDALSPLQELNLAELLAS
ncbi:MAG TPA: 5'/3'-nucleotidase SurE [Solirubrobacteraceae bacterium]|jgi:5'-nucleotidase